jgi:hypothetical protein
MKQTTLIGTIVKLRGRGWGVKDNVTMALISLKVIGSAMQHAGGKVTHSHP